MKTIDKVLKLDKAGDTKLLEEIKLSLSLKFDDELYLFSGNDCLIIKKIQRPTLAERFKNLSQKVEKRFEKEGIKTEMIDEAIKWARR